jgi:hypothetical protein
MTVIKVADTERTAGPAVPTTGFVCLVYFVVNLFRHLTNAEVRAIRVMKDQRAPSFAEATAGRDTGFRLHHEIAPQADKPRHCG